MTKNTALPRLSLATWGLVFTIVLLQFNASSTLGQSPELSSETRPLNIVFIIADDLGWGELGCYGQKKIPTPNIDRLALEGMRFTHHYSGAPVCAPSRCVLMTGKHLGHAEIRGNMQAKVNFPEFTEGQHPLSKDALTFMQVFQKAGYTTGAMGKWGLGPVGSTGSPDQKGVDWFFGYNCQAVAHSYYPKFLWRNSEQVLINERPIPGNAKQLEGQVIADKWIGEKYAPSLMIEEAEKFLDANHDKPFFLYLPFIEPHVAMHPPKASLSRFPAEWDTEPYRGQSSYLPHPRPRAAYAAMISDLDSYVGRILDSLEKHGLVDSTLVVFTSDNGTTHEGPKGTRFHIGGADPEFFNSTAGLKGYKGSVYEGGLRVPMIVRLPGKIPAGKTNSSACYFADWFPTLCDAAGIEKPSGLDGNSMWKSMLGMGGIENRKPMIWVFPEYTGQVAVRIGKWKVLRRGLQTKQPGPWEVYDIDTDPMESKDLAAFQTPLIEKAELILRNEVTANKVFPLKIPGVSQ